MKRNLVKNLCVLSLCAGMIGAAGCGTQTAGSVSEESSNMSGEYQEPAGNQELSGNLESSGDQKDSTAPETSEEQTKIFLQNCLPSLLSAAAQEHGPLLLNSARTGHLPGSIRTVIWEMPVRDMKTGLSIFPSSAANLQSPKRWTIIPIQ